MTAMSAPSALESDAANPLADRTVLLHGSPATYANRAYLRALGLRWDPARHQWHGTTTAERVRVLREQLGLEVRCFGTLEPPRGPSPPRPTIPSRTTERSVPSVRVLTPRPRNGSRTHAEPRTVYREDELASSRFSEWDVTSGLPDDSREEDERQEVRRLRDLRARVKAARAVVSATPGLAETLQSDWRKAARFYARFGVTEAMLRNGVASTEASEDSDKVG
jgi:hypothetical protein